MKKEFEYFRVPYHPHLPHKGRPHIGDLHTYVRGEGFRTFGWGDTIPAPKGGATSCHITVNGKNWSGRAFCSHSDNFCYKRGRDISLGRAMKLYEQEAT